MPALALDSPLASHSRPLLTPDPAYPECHLFQEAPLTFISAGSAFRGIPLSCLSQLSAAGPVTRSRKGPWHPGQAQSGVGAVLGNPARTASIRQPTGGGQGQATHLTCGSCGHKGPSLILSSTAVCHWAWSLAGAPHRAALPEGHRRDPPHMTRKVGTGTP